MLRDFATTLPVSVGIVPWPREIGRDTIIVKFHLVLDVHGDLEPVDGDRIAPLSLDVLDDRGELARASDFAPYKAACDIVVVGEAAADRASGGQIGAATLLHRTAPGESAAAREIFCRRGDPTDPAAMAVWSTGRIDWSRFQTAPPTQRVAFPAAPFNVRYMRSGARFAGRFVGPVPRVRSGRRARRPEATAA